MGLLRLVASCRRLVSFEAHAAVPRSLFDSRSCAPCGIRPEMLLGRPITFQGIDGADVSQRVLAFVLFTYCPSCSTRGAFLDIRAGKPPELFDEDVADLA